MTDLNDLQLAKAAAKEILSKTRIHASVGIAFVDGGKALAVRVQGQDPFLGFVWKMLGRHNEYSVPFTSWGERHLVRKVDGMLSAPNAPEALRHAPKQIRFIGALKAG